VETANAVVTVRAATAQKVITVDVANQM